MDTSNEGTTKSATDIVRYQIERLLLSVLGAALIVERHFPPPRPPTPPQSSTMHCPRSHANAHTASVCTASFACELALLTHAERVE